MPAGEAGDSSPDDPPASVADAVNISEGPADNESDFADQLDDVDSSRDGIDREWTQDRLTDEASRVSTAPVLATSRMNSLLSAGAQDAKPATTSQAIPLPTAEGSVQGMGESFAPELGSGAVTYNLPLMVVPGRHGVQPNVGLSYSSASGNGPVGMGWSLGVPFIARQSDRGMPHYVDAPRWQQQEDRYFFNGGQELVPVDDRAIEIAECGSPGCAPVPGELAGWQQYRARIEGSFSRFFRAPDGRRWVVQSMDGTRYDLGALPSNDGPDEAVSRSISALQSEFTGGQGRIYRWFLTRTSDSHGSTVYYFHAEHEGQRYLEDIFYTSPHATCGALQSPLERMRCASPLTAYARRIRFVYEDRGDVTSSFTSGWEIRLARRLRRIEMTSAEGSPGVRSMVRRYHLAYSSSSFWSLLSSVRLEGRPQHVDPATLGMVADAGVAEEALDEQIVGALQAPLELQYTEQPASFPLALGFGGFDRTIHHSSASPPYSVGANSDLFDVNSDGLADLVVTDPAQFHTPSGDPAVGVYFNGFDGTRTDPAEGGTFSAAIPTAVRADLSQVLRLSNLNISPMDVDGDGRSDYLHLPRARARGYFTPVRSGPAEAVTPKKQTWGWAYVARDLRPAENPDPRLDYAHDSQRIREFDVNNDHLVDIVRTTGLSVQVWLNLGWLPGGDGRYGSYTFDPSARTFDLSGAPIETCLPVAGTPLDFADPEVRLGDMNGDGITDIVRLRAGRVIYWPGRGEGAFGTGGAACGAGLVAGRYVEMAQPPPEVNPELADVQLADLNADGIDDIVQIRNTDVDFWLNYGGKSFTSRIHLGAMPNAPAYDTKVRIVDIDGSGTSDILYAHANDWQWVDVMGGKRPRLLSSVKNGLGAVTTFQYGSSVDDYLSDLAAADACTGDACEPFTWSGTQSGCDAKIGAAASGCFRRSGGSPVVSAVLRQTNVTDHLEVLGAAPTHLTTRYRYHDGYYEGIEQEFRGFGAADVTSVGDANMPTATQRTYFHQGRRPDAIASDRLADNPAEALKGAVYLQESYDESGTYLSTTHTSYSLRTQVMGLSGVAVTAGFASEADAFAYDTGPFVPGLATKMLPSVGGPGGGPPASTAVRIRGASYAHTRSTVDSIDGLNQARQATAQGRLRGEHSEPLPDERVVTHSSYLNVPGSASGWLWRPETTYIDGHGDTTSLARTSNVYSPAGDLLNTVVPVTQPLGLRFDGDSEAEGFGQPAPESLVSSARFDGWGNATVTCKGGDAATEAGCLRLGRTIFDADYALTPVSDSLITRRRDGSGYEQLESQGVWDRGQMKVLEAVDPNGERTTGSYDGFGRPTVIRVPGVRGCASGLVSGRYQYLDSTDPGSRPMSAIRMTAFLSCTDASKVTEAYQYVDALGRKRAHLGTGPEGGGQNWVREGLVSFDGRGGLASAYQPNFFIGDPSNFAGVVAVPLAAAQRHRYDAFGRQISELLENGAETRSVYHALSLDVWDPLDLSTDPRFQNTPTTTRMDGHGRAIEKILRNRLPDSNAIEFHRLVSTYRADGLLVRLQRAETSTDAPMSQAAVVGTHQTSRTFYYDSAGRRVASTDPDSDDPTTGATWRYLFNRAGDLVAMRDPRGCGQNYYYDMAGRAIAQTYVSCGEAQVHEGTVATLPAGAVGWTMTTTARAVDSLKVYDGYTNSWAPAPQSLPDFPADAGGVKARLMATIDRGHRSVFAYDRRGTAIWEARQLAVIPPAGPAPSALTSPGPPSLNDGLVGQAAVWDTAHTYARSAAVDHAGRTTGVLLPAAFDFGSGVTSPRVAALMEYDSRGLPRRTKAVFVGGQGAPNVADGQLVFTGAVEEHTIIADTAYAPDGLLTSQTLGDDRGGTRSPTSTSIGYDLLRRPHTVRTVRAPTGVDLTQEHPLAAVTVVHGQVLDWDAASNLIGIEDTRVGSEWPAGARPQSKYITHDALYRVAGVEYAYTNELGEQVPQDASSDWRAEQARVSSADPMRQEPAPMLSSPGPDRVASLTWQHDWLGNATHWEDDAHAFFERSIGSVTNGADLTPAQRPSALYLASDLEGPAASRGGWLEVDYGVSGNVVAMTVHAQCKDPPAKQCSDPGGALASRRTFLRANCSCMSEQAYQYRWDEANRLAEARRYDRLNASGNWLLQVRQRYRYDADNVRTVKQTVDAAPQGQPAESVALYVYPGDVERRGLRRATDQYVSEPILDPETEYLVSGARIVWQAGAPALGMDADHRISFMIQDALQSTNAVIDLRSGALTQYGTYYPNGARETLVGTDEALVPFEPLGFTGKEDDEEVGLVYFGDRSLIPAIGRWASPDPSEVHALDGGEALNEYHYVSARLVQGRDPIGLRDPDMADPATQGAAASASARESKAESDRFASQTKLVDFGDWDSLKKHVVSYQYESSHANPPDGYNYIVSIGLDKDFGNVVIDVFAPIARGDSNAALNVYQTKTQRALRDRGFSITSDERAAIDGLAILLAIFDPVLRVAGAEGARLTGLGRAEGALVKRVAKPVEILGECYPKEIKIAEEYRELGYDVVLRGKGAAGADMLIDGVQYEIKTLEASTVTAVSNNIRKGLKQTVDGRVIIDGRNVGLTPRQAWQGINHRLRHGDTLSRATEIRVLTTRGEVVWPPLSMP
jgi:RHS repeat-associated protein